LIQNRLPLEGESPTNLASTVRVDAASGEATTTPSGLESLNTSSPTVNGIGNDVNRAADKPAAEEEIVGGNDQETTSSKSTCDQNPDELQRNVSCRQSGMDETAGVHKVYLNLHTFS
jgi:hypothetical protein